MRTRFDEQLRQLNVELIRMGSRCEEAISIAAKALEGNEKVDAGRVFSLENDIFAAWNEAKHFTEPLQTFLDCIRDGPHSEKGAEAAL